LSPAAANARSMVDKMESMRCKPQNAAVHHNALVLLLALVDVAGVGVGNHLRRTT
jgi:hypothetical protein